MPAFAIKPLFCAILFSSALTSLAQSARLPRTPAIVTELGPHHRVWERVENREQPNGDLLPSTGRFIELASGMNRWDEGAQQWVPASDTIEIVNGVAVAQQGQMKVIFSGNVNSIGAIDLLTPDNKRLRSHLVGILYTDAASGESVILGRIKDSAGKVLPPNEVYYFDAFDGDVVHADVRFRYRKGVFSQDVILRRDLPSPADWGLNPASTRLELVTEFITPPAATVQAVALEQELDPVKRQTMMEPDLFDERLNFGLLTMGPGSAFRLGAGDESEEISVAVAKSWQLQPNGNRYLLEKVSYSGIKEFLRELPRAQLNNNQRRAAIQPPMSRERLLAGLGRPPTDGVLLMAQVSDTTPPRTGFVLDYELAVSAADFVFEADVTYAISGTVSLSGTVVIEPGAVFKFTNSPYASRLLFTGLLDCRAQPARPATLTGMDDDSVGEILPWSSGTLSGTYGTRMLEFNNSATLFDVHDVRVRHAERAFYLGSGNSLTLRHAQVGGSTIANYLTSGSSARLRDVLIHDSGAAFVRSGTVTNMHCEHVTMHNLTQLTSSGSTVYLTNSLLIAVTNNVNWIGSNVQTNSNGTGVFQTVGGGAYYLAPSSSYRNAGTTNIDPALARDLTGLTTYPPVVITNRILTDTVWFPQAQRDTDLPDLGAHYTPLDYLASGLIVSNATLLLTNGVTVGVTFDNGPFGLRLDSGSRLISQGTPLALNRLLRLHSVQESPGTSGSNGCPTFVDYYPASVPPVVRLRLTELPQLAGDYHHIRQTTNEGNISIFDLRDCQLGGGKILLSQRSAGDVLGWHNNLFHRVDVEIVPYAAALIELRNNLFHGGALDLSAAQPGYTIKDTLFDGTDLSQHASATVTNDYNGYKTGADRFTPNGSNDVLTNSITYESWVLGNFYQPSVSLFRNTGSRTADLAGLYYHTTTTNQVAETNSTVDIGFHPIALTGDHPVDTDNDGVPDYLEDANGNGTVDPAEADPNSADGVPLRVFIARPRNGSILP